MHNAVAKLMLLGVLFLITSVAWIAADATVSGKVRWQSGTPSQPPPPQRPIGPAPTTPAPDGANPPLCPNGATCT
jgi:hypothetical protein